MRQLAPLLIVLLALTGCGISLKGRYENNAYTSPDGTLSVDFRRLPQARVGDHFTNQSITVFSNSVTVGRVALPADVLRQAALHRQPDRMEFLKETARLNFANFEPPIRITAFDYRSDLRTGALIVAAVQPEGSQMMQYGFEGGLRRGDLVSATVFWIENGYLVLATSHRSARPEDINDKLYEALTAEAVGLASQVSVTGEDFTQPRWHELRLEGTGVRLRYRDPVELDTVASLYRLWPVETERTQPVMLSWKRFVTDASISGYFHDSTCRIGIIAPPAGAEVFPYRHPEQWERFVEVLQRSRRHDGRFTAREVEAITIDGVPGAYFAFNNDDDPWRTGDETIEEVYAVPRSDGSILIAHAVHWRVFVPGDWKERRTTLKQIVETIRFDSQPSGEARESTKNTKDTKSTKSKGR